ncbi:MAG: alanine--tRNA ligase, partial [Gallionella sp.]
MKSSEIRQTFLDFFASKGHTVVSSSSLVPHEDPTLLFTNAGMNQFKDVFLGFDKRHYARAASAQKCVRAGGKHNDLENVGYTARHHTFFEMLGNFSFGDYFKRDAISYAWELLTQVYKLPVDKLYVTVYAEDDEAYDIWTKEMGLAADRVIRIGDNKGGRYASDNFWMMGDTGPCGPCTEIFYDHGAHISGGLPGTPEEDGDRFIEIWNNVFMQFNRDEAGVMHLLPKPSVDTGMGLERISAVLQHVHANYEIDLFQTLIKAAARETHCDDLNSPSLKVLADHIRACSFLIADGVIPGNEGRGYVLRRIIRRAIRHGYKLGARAAFFHKMVPDLVHEMGVAYPELTAAKTRVMEVLKQEEERFFTTIEHGMAILESELKSVRPEPVDGSAVHGSTSSPRTVIFNGELAFKLHDTFGFPLDLTQDVCREHGVTVDIAGFDAAMANQKQMARAAGKFKMTLNLEYEGAPTIFHGYETLQNQGNVLALYKEGGAVAELSEGEHGVAVLDNTPFYAESGGQVGDSGELRSVQGIFAVEDTHKIQATVFGHHGVVKTGKLRVGDNINARVNVAARMATERNHSVTHLMH